MLINIGGCVAGRQHDVSECMDNCVFQIETALLKFDGMDESEDGKSSVVKRYVTLESLASNSHQRRRVACSMGHCDSGWSRQRPKVHELCQPTKLKTSFQYFLLAYPTKDTIYTTASVIISTQQRSWIQTRSRWRLLWSTFPLFYKFNFRYASFGWLSIWVRDSNLSFP